MVPNATPSTALPSSIAAHAVAPGDLLKSRDRYSVWAAALMLAAATFALFWQNLTTNFVGDDWLLLAVAHDHGQ